MKPRIGVKVPPRKPRFLSVGIPTAERYVLLPRPGILARPHPSRSQWCAQTADRVWVLQAEADVHSLGQRRVPESGGQSEQAAVFVPNAVSVVGLKGRPEAKVPHVEVPACCRVAHPEIQVVEVRRDRMAVVSCPALSEPRAFRLASSARLAHRAVRTPGAAHHVRRPLSGRGFERP